MNAMTTPRSRSTEFTRHVVATGAGPPLEDSASNSDLVPAVIKFTRSFFLGSRREGADARKRLYARAMNWRKHFVARRAKIVISRAKGVMNRRSIATLRLLFHWREPPPERESRS